MKHYEIMICNGHYPLTYKCTSIAEAFECLVSVSGWASHVRVDVEALMEVLVDLKRGNSQAFEAAGYQIVVMEGEV